MPFTNGELSPQETIDTYNLLIFYDRVQAGELVSTDDTAEAICAFMRLSGLILTAYAVGEAITADQDTEQVPPSEP